MPKRLKSPHIWKPEELVEANARLVLPAMAREYFAHGRKIVKKKVPASKLHPFRLDTKRFRYTLEIFCDLYGPSLGDRLTLLKPVQDVLGEVNDCVATREALNQTLSQDDNFDKFLKKRAKKKAAKFYEVWKSKFDLPGEEEAWVTYLSQVPSEEEPAPDPKPRSRRTRTKVNGHDVIGHEPVTAL